MNDFTGAKLTFVLPVPLLARLRAAAEEDRRSVSAYLRLLIERATDQEREEGK
jgi:hypothetical protein